MCHLFVVIEELGSATQWRDDERGCLSLGPAASPALTWSDQIEGSVYHGEQDTTLWSPLEEAGHPEIVILIETSEAIRPSFLGAACRAGESSGQPVAIQVMQRK